ncbi:selenocysteine-specific translation elongation factor [bacterium]|nr:selenocysteine-specific translation elongation factor [bacterium]
MSDCSKHRPPGLLAQGAGPEVHMMICTSGHVDHGKTELVKLLTGCNTDRLKAEQERGLTIELGFAPCVIGEGLCIGIVDVPGHEKFIKNMVAGVSGIEMTVLVIAANDGVMPQTVEHLQIMELLGIRHGIVALTKIDLVPEDRIRRVTSEIRDFLKGTFMEGAPVCPVSSQTFDGYPEFYAVLAGEAGRLSRRRRYGVFRMPVAHVFTQKGFGVVAMGIPVDGVISIGQQVELVPGHMTGKVRAIQQFMTETAVGEYGQCLGLNIPEFSKKPPVRGQVLSLPGYLEPAPAFHVRLTAVHGLRTPIRNAEEIKFHTGTIEEPGKIYFLEDKALPEDRTGFATVILSNPVAAAPFDRFIVRRPSPAATVAGGEIIALSPEAKKPRRKQAIEMLTAHEEFFRGIDPSGEEGMEKKIEYALIAGHNAAVSTETLSRSTLLTMDIVRTCLTRLVEKGTALPLGADYYVAAGRCRSLVREVESRLEKAVSEDGALSLALSTLRQSFDFPDRLWKHIQDDLERRGLIVRRGNTFVLPAAVGKLDTYDCELMERIRKIYDDSGFKTPRPDELPDLLGMPHDRIDRLLDYMCNERILIRLASNVVLSYDNFRKAQDMVVNIIQEKGELDSADFKYHIDSTRKYALAVLDFLDARRVTIRSGNNRKLTEDFRRNLL